MFRIQRISFTTFLGVTLTLFAWAAASAAEPADHRARASAPTGTTSTLAGPFAVAVVPSDFQGLAHPVARTDTLDAEQILEMTRRAVELIGGMAAVVPDTAKTVLLKPNIVNAEPPGSGVTTDPRLVRAVALLVHEAAPGARLLVAEGSGGWMSPALRDCTEVEADPEMLVDGFEVGGYRQVVAELRGQGIEIDCLDLNFDRTRRLLVPGGGLARDEYDLPASVLDADAWINLPVAKTHGSKVTCCMKNHFGLLPGKLYGWSKDMGTPGHPGIPHAPAIIDEAWVDLWNLTRVDLNVVDLIAGTEAGAFSGAPRRSNVVVAGRDPVATDLVVARLMGFNPDDFEFAELARQRGMGPGSIDHVDLRGAPVEPLVWRFKKAGVVYGSWGEWAEHADYGMSPRRWTLLGPLPPDHRFDGGQIASLAPTPGVDSWSPVVWFGHDRIDLDKEYDDPLDCAVYAFTRFTMPKADSVRFWAGSDEDLQIWIDGRQIYEHQGRRRHLLGQDHSPGFLSAGEHRLLVRVGQGRGGFDFSFNVCEPIDDRLYAGNTYPGLRWFVTREATGVPDQRVAADDVQGGFSGDLEPFHEVTFPAADPVAAGRTAPDSVLLEVAAPTRLDFAGVLWEQGGKGNAALDSTALTCVSRLPFGMVYVGLMRQQYAGFFGHVMEPVRAIRWLGLQYGLTYGYGMREAARAVQGWLAQGRVPVVGYRDGWALATGYRRTPAGVEARFVSADTVVWQSLLQPWEGEVPGGQRVSCPVIVVAPGLAPLQPRALVDSVAAIALEMARSPRYVMDRKDWGELYLTTGLAAWDEWVVEWERQPWTPAWVGEPQVRGSLAALRGQFLPILIKRRELAAEFFGRAGQEHGLPELNRAAEGYRTAAQHLRELQELLPETPAGTANPDDDRRIAGIATVRPLLAQARDAERTAAEALRQHLGTTEPLPPVTPDPLRHQDRGVRLLTWRTDFSQGVYDVTVRGDSLACVHRDGKAHEGLSWKLLQPMPHKEGWQVAVETLKGQEFYRVIQQPTAANDWTCVLRLDERFNWGGDPTELAVWAVPVEE